MPCLLVLIALASPRLVLLFIYLLTDWFSKSFATSTWPILGFLFMPFTTLAYMAAMINNGHVLSGWWVVLVIVAVLVDLGAVFGSRRRKIVVRRRWWF
jgi:hypothetical protein